MQTMTTAPAQRGFHAGEHAMQERSGIGAHSEEFAALRIRAYMPDQHRELFEKLPFVIAGALDGNAQPWATVLAGAPGFVSTPDAQSMNIAALPAPDDALAAQLRTGAPIGLLGIQPHSRRRNRMNGVITEAGAGGLRVSVLESFGNCPKYIQARAVEYDEAARDPQAAIVDSRLDEAARRMIDTADTLFIATAHPDAGSNAAVWGADVSHRGGPPGFVRRSQSPDGLHDVLTLPDFTGNAFFNTLGNLLLNPRAGLLFIDGEGRSLLQIAGTARIDDGPAREAFPGAQRLLHIEVECMRRLPGVLPLRWGATTQPAAQLANTGPWRD